jgi:hypothetical protein
MHRQTAAEAPDEAHHRTDAETSAQAQRPNLLWAIARLAAFALLVAIAGRFVWLLAQAW